MREYEPMLVVYEPGQRREAAAREYEPGQRWELAAREYEPTLVVYKPR